jgi:hypothetical protein
MSLHARTFRKAREQVRLLIADGFSTSKIKNYLIRWARWWVEIFASWRLQKILQQFFEHSWNIQISAVAMAIMPAGITSDCRRSASSQIQTGLQARL